MKRILALIVTLAVALSCVSAFAESEQVNLGKIPEKYAEYVLQSIEKSEFAEEQIDTDNIFVVENTSHINMKKGIESPSIWIALPIKETKDISYAGFENGEYVQADTNFPPFNGMEGVKSGKLGKYISENELSEPSEIKNLWVSERVHVFAYDVTCDGKEYVIPYYFTDESSFNEMEDENCVMELGKAYSLDEFISLCEKEAKLYASYKAEERENDNRPIVSVDENGDEFVKIGGISLDDVKKDILKNAELMEEGSYVTFMIDNGEENFESEHRYTSSSSKKELKAFIEGLFEELNLQASSGTVDSVCGDNKCYIKIRYKENGKWVLYSAEIRVSDSSVLLKTGNHGEIKFNVKNSDAIIEFLTESANEGLKSFKKKTSDENTPEHRGTLEGLTKTDVIEFECTLSEDADNDITKEVASPGKTIKGTFERYKENKYRSTYILTLSGNLGTISLWEKNQSSLSGEAEIFSNNIPVSFYNPMRYENGNLVEYKVGKESAFYSFKMIFEDNDIKEAYFNEAECTDLEYIQLTEDTKLSDEFIEKNKEVILREAKECADTLYDFGLFKGTDKGYELEKSLTREESATILVRLLGKEDKINAEDFDEVFADVNKNRWSYACVMYCYKNDITKGTGNDTFSPNLQIDASQFITLMMRLLGYTDVEPDTALEKSVEYKLLPEDKIEELTEKKMFTRSDMVQIVYNSLKTQMDDEKVFCDYLLEKGVLTEEEVEQIK